MNILLINNYTESREKLLAALKDHEVNEIPFQEISLINPEDYDCIVLSGGSAYSIVNNLEIYKDELHLIRTTTKPIFGICIGFELIGQAFGEHLVRHEKASEGPTKITKLQDHPLLNRVPESFEAYEHHRWALEDTETLQKLAMSTSGVEIVAHPTKPIYGCQFHPEKFVHTTEGHVILENFLKLTEESL